MDKSQREYLLGYLHNLEDKIDATRSELKRYTEFTHISVGSIASIASELALLQTEHNAICFTLNQFGCYTILNNNHVESITFCTDE